MRLADLLYLSAALFSERASTNARPHRKENSSAMMNDYKKWNGGPSLRDQMKAYLRLAVEYLRNELKDGPRLITELVAQSDFNPKILERAAKSIRIVKKQVGRSGLWTWELPKFKYTPRRRR